MAKTLSISEARRLLPSLVEDISRDGGRVDITRRGVPVASIVRTSVLEQREPESSQPANLAVEFAFDPADLVGVVRTLRSQVGRARRESSTPKRKRSSR